MNISSSNLHSLYKQHTYQVSSSTSSEQGNTTSENTTTAKMKKSSNDSLQLSPEAQQMFAMLQRAATETSTTDTTAVDGVEASADSTSTGTQLSSEELDKVLAQLTEAFSHVDTSESGSESKTASASEMPKRPMGPPPPGGRPPGGPGGHGGPGGPDGPAGANKTEQSSTEEKLEAILQLLNNEDDEDENATETEATATNLSISSSTTDL